MLPIFLLHDTSITGHQLFNPYSPVSLKLKIQTSLNDAQNCASFFCIFFIEIFFLVEEKTQTALKLWNVTVLFCPFDHK